MCNQGKVLDIESFSDEMDEPKMGSAVEIQHENAILYSIKGLPIRKISNNPVGYFGNKNH